MAIKEQLPSTKGEVIHATFPHHNELSLAAYKREATKALKREIAHFLGEGFVEKIPTQIIDDYCLNTINNDHPTGELLSELIVGFMRIYNNATTHDQAMQVYHFVDALHEKIKIEESQ